MVTMLHHLVLALVTGQVLSSVFSGRENICNLPECDCQLDTVICTCNQDSSFQESFSFFSDSRKLEHLKVAKCPKLVLLADSLSSESSIRTFEILDVDHVEFHSEAISVSRLEEINIENSAILTIHSHALQTSMTQSQTVNFNIINSVKTVIHPKAFAGIRSFSAININELVLEHNAFKLKVPTEEPTISLKFVNISSPSLSPNVFPSSFKSITIENSKIDKVNARSFSGLFINNITFNHVSINRIERGAFSDNTIVSSLSFISCNISSLSQKSVVAGISKFVLENSVIQSISKHGAINATVATVQINNNRFRTLGQESFQFISWDSVTVNNNTFDFLEQGSLNAIKAPSTEDKSYFTFKDNIIKDANQRSLVTQIPSHVEVSITGNSFGHTCDCNIYKRIEMITGYSNLSSPFIDLTSLLTNTSQCRLSKQQSPCFSRSTHAPVNDYLQLFCVPGQLLPSCARNLVSDDDDLNTSISTDVPDSLSTFYDDFLLLFQVKTTKGILLFLLFCVLCSVITVAICVGFIWVHRLCQRAKLVRDNLSGSFQFNSGEDKQQILYGSDQTTCHSLGDEEPAYAEIAEVHPPPKHLENGTLPNHFTTLPMFESTTLVTNVGSTLHRTLPSVPSINTNSSQKSENHESPEETTDTNNQTESTSLLSDSNLETNVTQMSRLSMSETSLTDEIMMALRDKLNDPNLYMSVIDAKVSPTYEAISKKEEDLYCAPLYSDPLQLSEEASKAP